MSEKSLKEKNMPLVLLVVVVNLFCFIISFKLESILKQGATGFIKDLQEIIPIGLAVLVSTLLNGLISSNMKYRIAFWRWHFPLPGCSAFSKHSKSDPRVSLDELTRIHGSLPVKPEEQNKLWYKIYQKHRDDVAVLQVHKDFLLMRDWCSLSFMALIFFGGTGIVFIHSWTVAILYFTLLVVQYLLTVVASRNYGVRLVTTVLAIESATVKNTTQGPP